MTTFASSETASVILPPGIEHVKVYNNDGEIVPDLNAELAKFGSQAATYILEKISAGNEVQLILPLNGVIPLWSHTMHALRHMAASSQYPHLNSTDISKNLHMLWTATAGDRLNEAGARQFVASRLGISGQRPVELMFMDDVLDGAKTYPRIMQMVQEKISCCFPNGLDIEVSNWFAGVKNPSNLAMIRNWAPTYYALELKEEVWFNSGLGMNSGYFSAGASRFSDPQHADINRLERLSPLAYTRKPTDLDLYHQMLKDHHPWLNNNNQHGEGEKQKLWDPLSFAYKLMCKIDNVGTERIELDDPVDRLQWQLTQAAKAGKSFLEKV